MAKKKEPERLFMQQPYADDVKRAKRTKIEWLGLNKRQELDTGELSGMKNLDTLCYPYLTPCDRMETVKAGYAKPLGLYGFGDFLLCVYQDVSGVKVDYITDDGAYTAVMPRADDAPYPVDAPRCVVKFFQDGLENTGDKHPVGSAYKGDKLLIFPDCVSMDYVQAGNFTLYQMSGIPYLSYAAVHLSRLFGVINSQDQDGSEVNYFPPNIYASAFNNYADFQFDTPGDIQSWHAWNSPAKANPYASDSKYTGIVSYQGHIVVFKDNFMHEVYNTKNPFRVQDLYRVGCIDNRSVCEVAGQLLFVSADDVMLYAGAQPRRIGQPLGIDRFTGARAGTDGRRYYLSCADGDGAWHFFVYDTLYGLWAEREPLEAAAFAANKAGMYALTADGAIVRLDTGDKSGVEWEAVTDFSTGRTMDVKHLSKIQLLADFEPGSGMTVQAEYDGDGVWRDVFERSGTSGREKIIITPRLSAHYGYKLRFSGHGGVKLYQMEVVQRDGGELFVSSER